MSAELPLRKSSELNADEKELSRRRFALCVLSICTCLSYTKHRQRQRWPDHDPGMDKKYTSFHLPRFTQAWLKESWSHARTQATREWVLLKREWLLLVWVHLVATNVAYYVHQPGEPLHDLGFSLLPALTPEQQIASELVFWFILASTIAFALSPFFVSHTRPLFTVLMLSRFLTVCMFAQALRVITFLGTGLPSPNYHCRPEAPDYNPPRTLYAMLNPLEKDPYHGCGDLVFSSHTIFVMLSVMTFVKYAPWMPKKYLVVLTFVFGCLVVMARKHYTLDIVVAVYTVPLIWLNYERYFPDTLPAELSGLIGTQNGSGLSSETEYDDTLTVDRIEKEPLNSIV